MRVVVIGAGLLGLTTAYYLRQHRIDVCVVDRQDGVAREASFANGGMLHASLANPWNEPGVLWRALKMLGQEEAALLVRFYAIPRMLRWGFSFVRNSRPSRYFVNAEKNARLALYSLRSMPRLREELGTNYDCETRGTLKIFRTDGEIQRALKLCERFAQWGARYEAVDARGAARIEPALEPITGNIAGAIFFPDDESGDAFKFCLALYQACVDAGVEFRFRAPVSRFVRQDTRIVAAEIDRHRLRADAFVLAAGSYSPVLCTTAGLRLPVQPVKGYSVTLATNGWPNRPQVPVIDDYLHVAACPLGDRLRVAGTAEFAGYDRKLNKYRVENLFNTVQKMFPACVPYMDTAHADRWTELRPMSCDGVAVMGTTPIANLFLNTGHGHLGWTMAAGAGRMVADVVAGAAPELDPAPYSIERF